MPTSILLIDLSSIAHPLFHVSASDPDPNVTSIKTVERVRALASGQPHVAICTEGGESFRKDLDATYKANRPEHDAALQHQIKLAIETLQADGFPVWSAPGYEADDIICAATWKARASGTSIQNPGPDVAVTIASADKDLIQLIGPRVTVHSLTNGTTYDAEAVKAKYGVAPDQFVDFLALCGDASDNIKGADRIGPKTAASLLQKYGNLEDLYTNLTEHGTQFTPAMATSLREFQPRMPLVRELIRLKTDAPIAFDEIFKPRVPADTEAFGDDDSHGNDVFHDDIDEAMPTLHEDATMTEVGASTAPVAGNRPVEQAAMRGQPSSPAGVMTPSLPPLADAAGIGRSPAEQAPGGAVSRVTAPSGPIPGQDAPGMSIGAGQPSAAVAQFKIRPDAFSQAMEPLAAPPVAYERQLEPTTLRECYVLAGEMFKSRLFSAYGTPQGVLSTILAGRELGLSAMASLRAFHIIEGKPTLSADLIRALIMQSGKAEYFRCTARDATHATFVTKRKGDPELAMTFTIDEGKAAWAKDEKAWKASGWGRNPADMCVARCSSKLARLVYADVVFNLYSPEEME